jgi:beta-lactamase class A
MDDPGEPCITLGPLLIGGLLSELRRGRARDGQRELWWARLPIGPLAAAAAILVGIAVGLAGFEVWAFALRPSRPVVVAPVAAAIPSKPTAPAVAPVASPDPSPSPPAAPTVVPAPPTAVLAAANPTTAAADPPDATSRSITAVPSTPASRSSNPTVVSEADQTLKAKIEAAMNEIMPLGSAEVIANGGTLVAGHLATKQRTAASTIKLALLIELFHKAESGEINLSDTHTISKADLVPGTGDLQNHPGKTLTLTELAHEMVTKSDNVATNILVDRVTMRSVNDNAHKRGFAETLFQRRMISDGPENYTSAHDLARMVHQIAQGNMISTYVSEKSFALLEERGSLDKDWLGLNLPRGAQLVHINGTLVGVRNDAGLITAPNGQSFVLAVCQDGLPSDRAGEAAISKLAKRVYDLIVAG